MNRFDPRVFEAPKDRQLHPFCKLADAAVIIACSLGISPGNNRAQPLGSLLQAPSQHHFKSSALNPLFRAAASKPKRCRAPRACRNEFYAAFDDYFADPESYGRVTILTLDRWRDGFLRKWGFVDAFIDFKNRENEKMLPLLPAVCRQIDSLGGAAQLSALIHGIFAGNIFDMGADATARAFLESGPDFFSTRRTSLDAPG